MYHININDFLKFPSNIGIFWKDVEGHYLGCNDILAEICKLKSRHEIVGKLDFDLPMQNEEAIALRTGDKKVIQAGCGIQFHYCITHKNETLEFVTFKAPLYDSNGKVIGVYGIDNYLSNDKLYDAMEKIGVKPATLKYSVTAELSQRKIDILYYLVIGMTAKQIATKLGISHRTIEHHIDNLRKHFSTQSRSELIAKALQLSEIKNRLIY